MIKKEIPRNHLQGIPQAQTLAIEPDSRSELQSVYGDPRISYLSPAELAAHVETDTGPVGPYALDSIGDVRPCPMKRAGDGTLYAYYSEQPAYNGPRVSDSLPTTFSPILQGLAGAQISPQAYERWITPHADHEAGAVPVVSDSDASGFAQVRQFKLRETSVR